MGALRTYILTDADVAKAMVEFVKQHAANQVALGRPLQVTISEKRQSRSAKANAFMWAGVLDQISAQAAPGGKRWNAKSWNECAKEQFLPDMSASGVEKWEYLPNGSRRLNMSTTDLDSAEMAEYLEKLQAYASTELGVVFDREDAHA